ncbi:hypothetical protein [Bacillus sp. IBL03825]|nr:hypothetical protein [Bacillus sp. IBL03825]MCR6850443.1 hypothetical protein [Bacillus sp. IBL03825]
MLNHFRKVDSWIEVNKFVNDDDVEVIDLCHVAWYYAECFVGDKFIVKK